MNITLRWLAGGLVLIAAFMAGRFSSRVGQDDSVGPQPKTNSVRSTTVTQADGLAAMRQRRHSKSLQSKLRRRAASLRSILSTSTMLWDLDDPFGDGSSDFNITADTARLFSWIMQAEHSEFPEVMNLIEKTQPQGGDPDPEVLAVLLARWSELDPDGARSWVMDSDLFPNNERKQAMVVFLAEEALVANPEWALATMKTAAQARIAHHEKQKAAGVGDDDPFGGIYFDLDLDSFYRRIAILFPEQRDEFRRQLGDGLFEFGENGWHQGLVDTLGARGLDTIAGLATDPETGYIDGLVFDSYAAKDWKKAKQWLEQNGGRVWHDRTVWAYSKEDDFDAAAEWYLSRATNDEDREERISNIAEEIPEHQKCIAWLEQMERAGEPVAGAWYQTIEDMIRLDNLDEVMSYLSKVSRSEQKSLLDRVYQTVSRTEWVQLGDEHVKIYQPREGQEAFAERYPVYKDFIRRNNREALQRLTGFVDDVEKQLGAE